MAHDPVDELSHFNDDELIVDETHILSDEQMIRVAAIVDRMAFVMENARRGAFTHFYVTGGA